MRKPLLLFVSLLFLVSLGSAITIESPSLSQYTQDADISLDVSNAEGDVQYSINGGENESCDCPQSSHFITAPQGENTLRVYDDEGSDSFVFFVDTEPPEIDEKNPEGTIFEQDSEIRIEYSDTSDVENSSIQVSVDGEQVNGSAGEDSFSAALENISEGNHTVSYNIPDEHWARGGDHNATGSWEFTLPVEPVLSGTAPGGVVDSAPTVEVTAEDPSGIDRDSSYIDVEGPEDTRLDWSEVSEDVSEVEHGLAFSHTFSDLEDGEYTVTVHVEDGNGNAAVETWEFTVDTTPPELSFHSHVAGDVVKGEERFEFNVSDLTEVERVNLTFGSQSATADSSAGLYTASVDTTLLEDGDSTVTVTAEDARGNSVTESISLTVDNHRPVVEDVELYPRIALGGLVISATARDSATNIIGSRFKIEGPDELITQGRMDPVQGEYDSLEEQVRRVVDLAQFDLDTGNYTALLMTRDSAGLDYKWFGKKFVVDNSLTADLQIEEKVLRQEVGTTATFNVRVANTGEVDELVSPSADSNLDVSVRPAEKRIGSGETKQFTLEVSLPDSEEAVGNHSVTITVDGLSSSDTFTAELIGQPHPEEREEIQAGFQELEDRLEELNRSRQDRSFSAVAEEQFENATAMVNKVGKLLEEGRYRMAEQRLEAARENLQETENSFTGEVTRARLGNLASAAVKLLALVAVMGLVYGGYRLIPPEEGYNPEKGYVHRPGGKHPLRLELEGRWKRMAARMERPEEEERRKKSVERWEGYDNRAN